MTLMRAALPSIVITLLVGIQAWGKRAGETVGMPNTELAASSDDVERHPEMSSETPVLRDENNTGSDGQESFASTPIDKLVHIHGFGGWFAGYTDSSNSYGTLAKQDGNWDHVTAGVALVAQPLDDLTIDVQFEFEVVDEEAEVELDYSVARWQFVDALNLQFGQAKQPFGIYSEFFDVGVLRPFVNLAPSIYGPTGIIAESYRGVSVSGRLDVFSNGWAVNYDVYTGDVDMSEVRPYAEPGESEYDEVEGIVYTIGGKLTVETPLSGLIVGVAGYTGASEPEEEGEMDSGTEDADGEDVESRRFAVGAHLEYLGEALLLRAEAARLMEEEVVNAFYAEVAYLFLETIQLVARFDWLATELDEFGGPSTLLRHKELAVGVNYLFNEYFVVKTSYHYVRGNRHAFPHLGDPEALQQLTADHDLRSRTSALVFGMAYAF